MWHSICSATYVSSSSLYSRHFPNSSVRNSAGEFEEAIDLIYTGKVDARKVLTKLVSLEEAPETIRDIERNPGNYMKVNVLFDC